MKKIIPLIFVALIVVIALILLILTTIKAPSKISGIQELVLNETDLQQLGMARDGDCQTDETQTTISGLPLPQYGMCNYTINSLNDTNVTIELQKFTSIEDLDNTYAYGSNHLYSVQGIISQNDYGDQSLFRVNNVNDYMGQLDQPGMYYYHLWICKDLYLIHITSSGRSKEADGYIANMGRRILSKFE